MRLFRSLSMALAAVSLSASALGFEAGAAKVNITPSLGTPLNGHAVEYARTADTIRDPLWVRALYMTDGTTPVMLVSADLCVINPELRNRVLELAPADVPPANIVLTATHTHSGPGGMTRPLALRLATGPYMPDLLEHTAQGFAQAMAEAVENRQPATVGYGTTTQRVLSRNSLHGAQDIDTQIAVVRVNDSEGDQIAIVANFAAQPDTVLEEAPGAVSADYPGAYYERLEELASKGCVALFLNGGCADQRIEDPEDNDGVDRMVSVGRLFAVRAKGVANVIDCADLRLHVRTADLELPETLARSYLPASVTLKTLEIGDLVMTFFPGVPTAGITLALRERALAAGYEAQFSVACANDHLMCFVPRSYYTHEHAPARQHFYGPSMDQFLLDGFSRLFTRGEAPPQRGAPVPAQVTDVGRAAWVELDGDSWSRGYAQGAALRDTIADYYQRMVVDRVRDGALQPESGLWTWAPSFVDVTPLALPALAASLRPCLVSVPDAMFSNMEGLAAGAELPFDAVWLSHCAPGLDEQGDGTSLYTNPFCTMFAVAGDRAGADGLLAGRNFDWRTDEPVLASLVRPDDGYRHFQVGMPWSGGAFSGMNETGLVVCAERVESLGPVPLDAMPVELLVGELLLHAGTLEEAAQLIEDADGLRGYHILVAHPGGADGGPAARVYELDESPDYREERDGLLLGADPEQESLSLDVGARYARVAELVDGERIIGRTEVRAVLRDREEGRGAREQIFSEYTRCSILFLPRERALAVAFVGEDGLPGEYRTVTLEPSEP